MKTISLSLIALMLCLVSGLQADESYSIGPVWQRADLQDWQQYAGRFNAHLKGDSITMVKDTCHISGFVTANRVLMNEVIIPIVQPLVAELRQMPKPEMIGQLALIIFNTYRHLLGTDVYRWGGDLLDLDDPQDQGIRYPYRFGLDCSGFTAAPYELAVQLNLLRPEEPGALFSSAGYQLYCRNNRLNDHGGRCGTGNRFRLDTAELATLGREIMTIPQNSHGDRLDLTTIQPGDIIGFSGHFGIVAGIGQDLYYLESGGWAVPERGWQPVRLAEAVTLFARKGTLSVRRCLTD